jgi:chlorobactene glucosyltransferase
MGLSRRRCWSTRWFWVYAAAIVAFYAVLARRTRPTPDSAQLSAHPGADDDLAPDDDHRSSASIVLPARDEERNIVGCVDSLLTQDYPHFEVIVVDDASTDATSRLLADLRRTHPQRDRLRVVRVDRLPPGWAGKPHALHTGAALATGEWLLFTDADTRHKPATLRTTVRIALARRLDLLSLGTTQDLPDFWGRVLMPLAYMGISMLYPPAKVNDPRSAVAIANGQYILIHRAFYQHIGGYDTPTMRATILDDRDLALAVKRAGGRMALVDGRMLVQTTMYHGLAEHWNGWSKNAYVGSRGGLAFFALMVLGLPAVCVLPFALLLAGLAGRRLQVALPAASAVAAILTYRTRLNRELGVPASYAWTHPLGALVFAGILIRSFWRVRSGHGVVWRGRTYQP